MEIEAGATGSARLRALALGALRRLINAVGDGDALAFFVPGLTSGLGKALVAAGAFARRNRQVTFKCLSCWATATTTSWLPASPA